ncbi:hypothetical protein K445DRAFT_321952 [Daldinia sp. EC12]|nr:hypothetical protein K445DRAFT_321952 [Daldinia sp. EC12]
MKTSYTIFLLAAQMLSVLSSPAPAASNADCGAAGTFEISQLPKGVDPSAVRTCIEHPLGNSLQESVEKREGALFERACWHGKAVGCTKGYCWKTCGDGPWCWTARNSGFGDWYTCKSDSDCSQSQPCSQSTAGKDCKSCGCSC